MMSDTELRENLLLLGLSDSNINEKYLSNSRRLFAQAVETPGGLKIQTIHSFYTPGQNPNDREPIDALEILKALEKSGLSPETQEQSLTWLSSLRKKLNRELFNIISQQGNPAELIIGVDYKFIQILKTS